MLVHESTRSFGSKVNTRRCVVRLHPLSIGFRAVLHILARHDIDARNRDNRKFKDVECSFEPGLLTPLCVFLKRTSSPTIGAMLVAISSWLKCIRDLPFFVVLRQTHIPRKRLIAFQTTSPSAKRLQSVRDCISAYQCREENEEESHTPQPEPSSDAGAPRIQNESDSNEFPLCNFRNGTSYTANSSAMQVYERMSSLLVCNLQVVEFEVDRSRA